MTYSNVTALVGWNPYHRGRHSIIIDDQDDFSDSKKMWQLDEDAAYHGNERMKMQWPLEYRVADCCQLQCKQEWNGVMTLTYHYSFVFF